MNSVKGTFDGMFRVPRLPRYVDGVGVLDHPDEEAAARQALAAMAVVPPGPETATAASSGPPP